jgi:hypothetical protein
MILVGAMYAQGVPEPRAQPAIGKREYPLSAGTTVPAGQLEAIGSIVGGGTCTASLIDQKTVLTAAHCMCDCVCAPGCKPAKCVSRATFTLLDVYPVDNPGTAPDESKTRKNVSIGGAVILHPDFCTKSWLYYDYAIVKLDRPVYEVAKVRHACLSPPTVEPRTGDRLTLVGTGTTGAGCTDAPKGKRMATLQAEAAGPLGIKFSDPVIYACPGDSGGPVLDPYGCVAGVSSHNDIKAGECTYRPTYPVYAWISAQMESLGDDVRAATCRLYAQTAVSQNEQRRTRLCKAVAPNDPKWVSSLDHHFNWCMQQGGQQALDAGTNEREAFLASTCKPAYESGMTKRCVAYASTAVAQQRSNVNRRCSLTGPEWSPDFDYHYKWCAGGAPKAATDAGTARRSTALQNCR